MEYSILELSARIALLALAALAAAVLLRDLVYRVFFTYPATSLSGRFAAHIEDEDIPRWVAPLTAGLAGKKDVVFVGNSHVMDAIDPAIVRERTGLDGFNLALYGHCAFNLLLLLIRYQHFPRHVVIDVSSKYSMAAKGRYFEEHFEEWVRPSPERLKSNRFKEFVDRAHTLLPSLFAPRPYRGMLRRSLEKLRKLREKKHMYIGRYAPFRPFTSYSFRLDKTTNHRAVFKVREKSRQEAEYEDYLMGQCLEGLPRFCDPGSPRYRQTLAYNETALRLLLAKGVQITVIRLPLHPRVVSRENHLQGRYFEDIRAMCARHGVRFVDFNGPETAGLHKHYEFYNDGHHVYRHTAEKISGHLAWLLSRTDKDEAGGQTRGQSPDSRADQAGRAVA